MFPLPSIHHKQIANYLYYLIDKLNLYIKYVLILRMNIKFKNSGIKIKFRYKKWTLLNQR